MAVVEDMTEGAKRTALTLMARRALLLPVLTATRARWRTALEENMVKKSEIIRKKKSSQRSRNGFMKTFQSDGEEGRTILRTDEEARENTANNAILLIRIF
jgi:hypothetical protein